MAERLNNDFQFIEVGRKDPKKKLLRQRKKEFVEIYENFKPLVAADQAAGKTGAGASLWRFSELGAGEKRVVKASFRIKSGTGVGTGVQLKSILTYQDQVGNRY